MPINKGKQDFPVLLISTFLLLFFFSFNGTLLGNTILVLDTEVITNPLDDYATFLENGEVVEVVDVSVLSESESYEEENPEEPIEEVEVPEEVMPQEVTSDEEEYQGETEETEEGLLEVDEPVEGLGEEFGEKSELEQEVREEEKLEEEIVEKIEEEQIEPVTIDIFMEDSSQFSNTVIIIGENAPTETFISALQLASTYGFKIVKDSDIEDISTMRAIALGSSSVNAVSAAVLEQGAVASDEGAYFIYENKETGGVVLVVAGENRRAVRDLLQY